MKITFSLLSIFLSLLVFPQKKILTHADKELWHTIEDEAISPDGNFVIYSLVKGEKDSYLKIKRSNALPVFEYDRGSNGQFSFDSKFAFFTIKAWKDSITELKRKKVKKDKLPKDSLGIFNLSDNSLMKFADIKSYKIPKNGPDI